MSDRNEGDIGFIPRSTVIDFMRAHWQDPVGFHEAMAAQLGIDEEDYAPEPGNRRYEWSAFVSFTGDVREPEAREIVSNALDVINRNPDGPRIALVDGIVRVEEAE